MFKPSQLVLDKLLFNLCYLWRIMYIILLLHRTQTLDAWRHFIHSVLILWLTSLSISPSLHTIDPKYQKIFFLGTMIFQTTMSFLMCSSAEVAYHLFSFSSTKSKTFRV
jgi:predicted membrane channel-forming protein YqfA (hemolysin III family)